MLLCWMFISSYTTIYLFESLYFSEYDVRMQVSFFKFNIYLQFPAEAVVM